MTTHVEKDNIGRKMVRCPVFGCRHRKTKPICFRICLNLFGKSVFRLMVLSDSKLVGRRRLGRKCIGGSCEAKSIRSLHRPKKKKTGCNLVKGRFMFFRTSPAQGARRIIVHKANPPSSVCRNRAERNETSACFVKAHRNPLTSLCSM